MQTTRVNFSASRTFSRVLHGHSTGNNTSTSIYSFIHSVSQSVILVCLMTGPQPLPKRVLYRARSGVSFLNFKHPPFSLRTSSSCLLLLPLLPITSALPLTFLQKCVSEGSSYARCDKYRYSFFF
jgi:hypothetical protein